MIRWDYTHFRVVIATHIRLRTNWTTYNLAPPDALSTASMQHKESAMSRWPAFMLLQIFETLGVVSRTWATSGS